KKTESRDPIPKTPATKPSEKLSEKSDVESGKLDVIFSDDVEISDDIVKSAPRRRFNEIKEEVVYEKKKKTLKIRSEEIVDRKGKWDPKKKKEILEKKFEKTKQKRKLKKEVLIPDTISVVNLSNILDVSYERLAAKMEQLGFENTSSDFVLNAETASLIADEYGFIPTVREFNKVSLETRPNPEDWSIYPTRAPVVTILGHVDHGKTTLLDTLRHSAVAAGEAGGITQHIGAFSVTLPSGRNITFLDTPGHAAFTAMRQRGAQTTDIAILVVAADDGVMPQTVEAIKHILDANVPFIVAINKCDKISANSTKVKQELMNYDVVVEDMGGEIPSVEVSGLTGKGLDVLEETIIAVAEVMDLRGDSTGPAEGVVLEAKLDRQRGNVATVLIKRGTLSPGSVICSGVSWCKVRNLFNENHLELENAGPSTPVEVVGWKNIPEAGDTVIEVRAEDELAVVKKVVESRLEEINHKKILSDIEDINEKRIREKLTDTKENLDTNKKSVLKFPIIVKADVQGSLEALLDEISALPGHEIIADIVSTGIGPPTESEIETASSVHGIVQLAHVLVFSLPVDKSINVLSKNLNVNIESHGVIYKLLDRLKELMIERLPPAEEIIVNGEAQVLKVFSIDVKKKAPEMIAGCRILTGKVSISSQIRILRNGEKIYDGTLKTFKNVKKDITESTKGSECGMGFENFRDLQEGDKIQAYTVLRKPRTSL
ncbi:hypothetical protein HK096_000234, partial [Nowakowskiella sp. JEL0078]